MPTGYTADIKDGISSRIEAQGRGTVREAIASVMAQGVKG